MTVDGNALSDNAGGDVDGADDLGIGLDTLFDFTYTAHLPGEIDEEATNGRVNSDGAVFWELPLDSTETLTAAASGDSGGSNLVLILVVIGILVLGLIALAAVVFFIFMNRRDPAPAAVAVGDAPAPAYDPDQPTQPVETVDPESRSDPN